MGCSQTQTGPEEFRWATPPPPRPRGRQFSLQFSRQSSKASVRSLPSPKALGRRRRGGLARFQSRRAADTLQLPGPEYDQDFQGVAGPEDERDGTKTDDSQSQSSENK